MEVRGGLDEKQGGMSLHDLLTMLLGPASTKTAGNTGRYYNEALGFQRSTCIPHVGSRGLASPLLVFLELECAPLIAPSSQTP